MALNLAKRAALAAGRAAPTKLSEGAAEAWQHVHWYLGGNPRLLCIFLEELQPTQAGIVPDQESQPEGVLQATPLLHYLQPCFTPDCAQCDVIIWHKLLGRHISEHMMGCLMMWCDVPYVLIAACMPSCTDTLYVVSDLGSRILELGVADVEDKLLKLQNLAQDEFWSRLGTEGEHRKLQESLLRAQLAAVLLDQEVVRQAAVDEKHSKVTWGIQEADGYIKLDLQVWHHW